MNDLTLFVSEYGLYLFIGLVWLIATCVYAIYNAEDCTLPAECFDCKESACGNCNRADLKPRSEVWVWKPVLGLSGSQMAGREKPLSPIE